MAAPPPPVFSVLLFILVSSLRNQPNPPCFCRHRWRPRRGVPREQFESTRSRHGFFSRLSPESICSGRAPVAPVLSEEAHCAAITPTMPCQTRLRRCVFVCSTHFLSVDHSAAIFNHFFQPNTTHSQSIHVIGKEEKETRSFKRGEPRGHTLSRLNNCIIRISFYFCLFWNAFLRRHR